ncbi:hypothetical protein EP47_13660 [Legionella norrlandica]|uniref:Uncharacterized protein n=1 Tax=Legionella norrlandica TaxID=1498499 RepID=A0A0A2SSM3_9GAMM|nr:hypothetical protein EP47_13660 [Legionella norrlandica]
MVRKRLHLIFIELDKASEESLIKLGRILYNLEAFAKRHGCPGYLLLANGYIQLAIRYQLLNQEEQSAHAFQLCWKYLHLAELSENDSEESINNAYFGKGLALSNPVRLSTIAEMKSYCRKAAGELLNLDSQAHAEFGAYSMYRNVKEVNEVAEDAKPSLGL